MSVYEVLLLNMAPEILLLLSMQFLLLLILPGNTVNFSKQQINSSTKSPHILKGSLRKQRRYQMI